MLNFLKCVNDESTYYLLGKKEFTIGRKDCDFQIQNDKSISRKHAIIRIKEGQVFLQDCKATYFTHHNDRKLDPNKEVQIKDKDEIHFGIFQNKYRFEQHKFVTTASRLESGVKAKLKKQLSLLGVEYVENWNSACTHLTVDKVTVTLKLLHALIDGRHIVQTAFWTKFVENAGKHLPPPDINKYNKPPVAEALLNQIELKTDPMRNNLFKGKVFVFLKDSKKKEMEEVIRKAGGSSISWEKDPLPLEDITKSPKEFLIIRALGDGEDSSLNEVIKSFSKQGKRTIPLQEIATALLHCCCEKDCNPNFNRVEQVFQASQNLPTQNKTLAAETESECFAVTQFKTEATGKMIIPDTLEANLNEYDIPSTSGTSKIVPKTTEPDKQSAKRATDDELKENPFKKMKVDLETTTSTKETSSKQDGKENFLSKSVTQKRKAENMEMEVSKPAKKNVGQNPFAFLNKNKVNSEGTPKKENPFKLIKKPSETQIPDSQVSKENPFLVPANKKKREVESIPDSATGTKKNCRNKQSTVFHSTLIENNPDKSADFSKLSRINSADMNHTWFSKSVKIDTDENLKDNVEPDLQEFIDRFKNTIVVEVMAKLNVTAKNDIIDGNEGDQGKPNFKKFRKVLPLRPQTTIIGKTNFIGQGPADISGIADNRRTFHVDSDTDDIKVKKKPPKKFFI